LKISVFERKAEKKNLPTSTNYLNEFFSTELKIEQGFKKKSKLNERGFSP